MRSCVVIIGRANCLPISEAVEGLTTDIDERVNYIDETLNSNGIWR